jgi:transcriptional regulator with XRE-family HTH domain
MSHRTSELPSIGERIRQLRVQQKPRMTQRELAERAGVSVDLISKLEQGTKQTALLVSLHKIARALDVDVSVLLARPERIDVAEGTEDRGVLAIRRAITAPADDAEQATLDDLERSTRYAWSAHRGSHYDVLAGMLPAFITAARATASQTPNPEVFAVLSDAYVVSAPMLVYLGYVDLAYLAMERAVAAADRSGDPLRRAAASGRMSWMLLHHTGSANHAMRLATTEADQIEPRLGTAGPDELAVWGGLLVDAAVAAARVDLPAESDDLLNLAETAATRLQSATHQEWAAEALYGRPRFGLPLVVMQQVDGAVITGRPGRALALAAKMPPDGGLPLDWKARHLADIASAQTSLGKDSAATETLLGIERMSPDWMRYQAYPRTIVRELLERERRARTPRLRALAARLNVA